MRKNNSVNLAQVMNYNASRRGVINRASLGEEILSNMLSSGYYKSENNYEQNMLIVRVFSDGFTAESACRNQCGRIFSNGDEMFFPIDEMPRQYRALKKLLKSNPFRFHDGIEDIHLWLEMEGCPEVL